jgi:predicted RNA-binding protein YlqC (UPF0109 family)
MKNLLERIARELVDAPDQIEIDIEEDEKNIRFVIRVAPDDVGKLVGKRGRTAQAIRVLLSAVAGKQEKRAQLEISEGKM